jgi:DNA helicase II / ATP-dependent DNA helicase PcrA
VATRVHLVHGPPGTGKTTFLARQALIASQRYGGDKLIVASLTRAAAAEVAGRDTGIPAKNVGTLHAHAYRALSFPELAETKQGYADWNLTVPGAFAILASARDPEHANPEDGPGGSRTEGEKQLAAINVLRAQLAPRESWPHLLQLFDERWEAWKRRTHRLDFTDLIERATLIPHPLDPRVVFLDEAQDMSALEMRLALHWATRADQTVIVGDADQCLFEWRGSSQAAFLSPEVDSVRVLSQSYRVPRAVHGYSVAWVSQIRDRPDVTYEPRDADGSVKLSPARYDAPAIIVRAADEQPAGETMMVLGSCSYMLDPILRELKERGIPFHNPYRRTNGRWNPLASANRMLALLRIHPDVWGDEARAWTFDELRLWLEPLDGKGWLVRGIKEDVKQLCASGRRDDYASLDYTRSMIEPGGDHARIALDSADPMVLLRWWVSKLRPKEAPRFKYAAVIAHRFGPAALREEPRVIVGTIHSVKGGEADTVYVFPDLSLAAYAGEGGRQPGWINGGHEARAPIVRLFYVAFTRARQRLYLCQPKSELTVKFPPPENPPNGGGQSSVTPGILSP